MSGLNHKWTAAEDALLGKMIDREVARRISLKPLSMLNRRKKLGIMLRLPRGAQGLSAALNEPLSRSARGLFFQAICAAA